MENLELPEDIKETLNELEVRVRVKGYRLTESDYNSIIDSFSHDDGKVIYYVKRRGLLGLCDDLAATFGADEDYPGKIVIDLDNMIRSNLTCRRIDIEDDMSMARIRLERAANFKVVYISDYP